MYKLGYTCYLPRRVTVLWTERMANLGSVFDIIQTSTDKVSTFCEKITEVFAHAKSEITEFLLKLENDTLIQT